MITTSSPIVGKGGTVAEALASLPFDGAADGYAAELFRLCNLVGFDYRILFAQFVHETNYASSFWWRTRKNPAGIGITGDAKQDAASHTWTNGIDAARAHVAHMGAYTGINTDSGIAGETIRGMTPYDPRYGAVELAGFDGTVTVLGDLGNGKWATDPEYAKGIAAKANLIFKDTQEASVPDLNMTKGLIPLPTIEDDIVDVGARNQSLDCRGYDWLGTRPDPPKFLVIHRAQCPPEASNSGYFHQACCPALTDLEVNCVTGHMKRFVRRGGSPSGWANGVVNAPYGDALAWLNLHDWDLNSVNRDGEACEVSGWFLQPGAPSHEDPVADPCWQSLAQWIASRAHDYGIGYLDFPVIPSEGGRSYITWHQEWTIGTGKVCPGKTVMDGTPALIERARAIMKQYQEQATVPVPTPNPPAIPSVPWKRGDVGHKRIGTVPALAYVIEVTARKDAPVRVAASAKKGVAVIDTIAAGKTGVAIGGFLSGGRKWLAIDCGPRGVGRALASDFHEVLPMP